jgi:hypothetical protein
MSFHPDTPLGRGPGGEGKPPRDGWRHLRGWMAVLGVVFVLLGVPSLSLVCCAAGFDALLFGWGSWQNLLALLDLPALLLLAWGVTPIVSGLLLLKGAERLERPGGESGTFLIVVAASTFVGLAWIAVTAALLLGGLR